MSNQQLSNKLYKSIIRNIKRREVYSSFKNNIWGAHMKLTSKCYRSTKFLLCVIDIFSIYTWVVLLKSKAMLLLPMLEIEIGILDNSKRKIKKICDCNGTGTHNHLVCQRTFNHLVKLAK